MPMFQSYLMWGYDVIYHVDPANIYEWCPTQTVLYLLVRCFTMMIQAADFIANC